MHYHKDKLKICLLSYRGNPYCGGQGIYLQYLAQELRKLGHEVHALVGPPYPIFMNGASVDHIQNNIYFGSSSAEILARTSAKEFLNPLHFYEYTASRMGVFPEIKAFSFRAYFRLREILKHERYDIIHDNQCLGYGFLLMKHFGIPLVSTIHHPLSIDRQVWFEQPHSLKSKIKRLLYYPLVMQRLVANRLDGIITVSEDSAVQIQKAFGVDAKKIRVVYNGLDASIFRPVPEVEKVPKRIIFVGNVADPKKGIEYVLQAMPLMDPNIHLIIVNGGTPPRISSQDIIQHYGLEDRVHITGQVDQGELVKWYSSAQLAVVPSLYEGFGFPAAEAMACELPVVATTAGALPEVIGSTEETGCLVPPRNPDRLAEAINGLLKDPAKCLEMGHAARQRIIDVFSWDMAARQLVQAYREVMSAYR
ncbi:MAG: glycosyltransferase family 4 protein [Deltaproteobacteria bacterium]|nr:glycosyltransferase family 4 protein [Deltaproteobacteria bacterium]MBW2050626.1 glycosyltransferase family 4 protein [Deltaproteobacteria bacterium]MBW2139480.1 glycosyltransferase family 4 protein [Deltaproteobacteria bacterium]MBW2322229.1 glycosyltransferase family 4 protein [Deltaproteobacteria bacterium]